jgi:putative ABC transport system permease protein
MQLTLPRLALRNLSRNRRRSALTAVAIVVGVALVIFAWGLMSSLLKTMVDDVVDRRLGALLVRPKIDAEAAAIAPVDPNLDVSGSLLDIVKTTPGVRAATPRLRFNGMLGNGITQSMVVVTAVDPVRELTVCPRRPEEVVGGEGHFVDAAHENGVVVGRELSRGLSAPPGASLTLQASGPTGQMNALDVDVGGVGRGASFLEGKGMITVPLAFAQSLLKMQGRATEIAIALNPDADVARVQAALQARLPADVEVTGWGEQLPFLRDAQLRLRVILGGVAFVLFAIAIFGVVNTMLMSVWERVKEIGTLLALGLRRRQIVALFLLEGAMLGVLGGTVGVVLGSLATFVAGQRGLAFTPPGSAVSFVLHPSPSPVLAFVAFVVAAFGSLAASALPARRAAQLDPVEALRA